MFLAHISSHHIAESLSLAMTIPTITLAISVIYLWGPSAREALFKNSRDANQWFILGVVGGFIGATLDNAYWFLPWSASFIGESQLFQSLTEAGIYFNVVFRQGLGIFAAYCHIKAAELSLVPRVRFLNKLVCVSYIIGFSYVSLAIILF